MANRRMLSKSISTSRKVGALKTDFHRLLYTWLIPHTDDFGLLDGDPYHIKHCIIPTLRRSEKQIVGALQDMGTVGLIYWYRLGDVIAIQVKAFDDHQTGLHKRTNSKWPDFINAQVEVIFEDLAPYNGNFRELPGTSATIEQNEQKGSKEGIHSITDVKNKYSKTHPKVKP